MPSTIAAPISVLALDSKPFVGVKAVVTGELTGTQRASLQADMDRLYAQSVHIIHTNGLMSREEAIALNYGPGKIEDVEAEIKRDYERAKALGLLPVWRKT